MLFDDVTARVMSMDERRRPLETSQWMSNDVTGHVMIALDVMSVDV